ncbi:MAG: phosphoadenylyl-sulfate reductase [Gammaproteobacteria bacterium]
MLDETGSELAALATANATLAEMPAESRISWALQTLPGIPLLSSSFGAQSAVSLHLITRLRPEIPVVLIDTGYLFPETYRFVEQLTARLQLDLRVYRSLRSPAWQEAAEGQRWNQGIDGLEAYNHENKVEPMQRALSELGAGIWFAGLRRDQSASRHGLDYIQRHDGIWKVHAIADWTDRDVYKYLQRHDLPYHPLWDAGYVSIGDVHTTRPLSEVDDPEDTRFFGLKRECGLHEAGLLSAPTDESIAGPGPSPSPRSGSGLPSTDISRDVSALA